MWRFVWIALAILVMACSGRDKSIGPRAEITQSTAPPPLVLTANPITTPDALANPIHAEIEPRDYILGPATAPVTIVMYGDFQCGRCARYARDLEILRGEYPTELRLIWRHLPATQTNDKAALALQAAEAAAAQGRFWDMHAILFTTQSQWLDQDLAVFKTTLVGYARAAGLDVTAFAEALDDERYLPLIDDYRAQADALGIVGIPTLLINGELLNDRDDLFGLQRLVELVLLSERHFEQAPPMTIDTRRDYWAVIETEKGAITIDLLEQDAPITVNNFVFLVENGWYTNTSFFLVIPDFYAQAGDPSETGRGHPGYTIEGEHANGLQFNRAGVVAMSHPPGELEQNGSQFFITYGSLPEHETEWDGQYTIFGFVTEGLDVVQKLTPRNPGDPLHFPNPPQGDLITSIRIVINEAAP